MIKPMDPLTSWLIAAIAVLFVISLTEAIFLVKLYRHYNNLLRFGQNGLMDVLEGIQKTLSSHEGKSLKLADKLESLEAAAKNFVSKVVVKRFNPFSNTGGDQSFILGLLDGNQNGVVITSLHSRENTRFYVKSVVGGEGDPHALSDDEKKILKKG